jgi:short subunit dehydrogenase-like uncharacterized protein
VSGRIVVYGATGYTGRLVAAELAAARADFVLAGRSREKLEALATDVGGSPEVQAVALDDSQGLRALLEPCAAVIACAGPFAIHGEPVVRTASEVGTHYLDTTGEQGFMKRVFDEFGPVARANGAALITGMGFDYVPGDMIASLTARDMGPLTELSLNYAVQGFGPSRGTARTALGQITGSDVQWLEGDYAPGDPSISRGKFDFGGSIGIQRMTRYPAGEHITVPRHVETRTVRTALTASTTSPAPVAAPVLMTGLGLALKTPFRRVLDAAINRLSEGPATDDRRAARFTIVCDALAGARRRRGEIRGEDVYGMTARSVVAGALRCAEPGFQGSGALAPSEAFDPASFLPELSEFGIEYEVNPR